MRKVVFWTLILVSWPSMAAIQEQSFSVTGDNGECGIGRFTFDDQEIVMGGLVAHNPENNDDSMLSFSLTLRGGKVVGEVTTFTRDDCTNASARKYPDFTTDINFTCDNGVNITSGEYYNSVLLNSSSGSSSRLTTSPGINITCAAEDPVELDQDFGVAGVVRSDAIPPIETGGLAIDSAGRIVVVGESYNDSDTDFEIVRLSGSGAVDTDFGAGGSVTVDITGTNDYEPWVTVVGSDNIVVAGESFASPWHSSLVKLTSDGTLDTSFGGDGKVLTGWDGSDGWANAVIGGAGDTIITAGTGPIGGTRQFALAKHLPNGSLDDTFGNAGKVLVDLGGTNAEAYGVVVDANGSLVVAGRYYVNNSWEVAAVRFSSDGVVDTNFGANGMVLIGSVSDQRDFVTSVALDGQNRILIAGYTENQEELFVLRLLADGSVDTTFADDGFLVSDLGAAGAQARVVAVDSQDRILLGGAIVQSDTNALLLRLLSDGTVDDSFGEAGKIILDVADADYITALGFQPTGKIVAGGKVCELPEGDEFCTTTSAIWRFHNDGAEEDKTIDPAVLWFITRGGGDFEDE